MTTRTSLPAPVDTSDLWSWWDTGAWAVIPTNTQVRADGTAVMGAGLAKAAAARFPDLPARYGDHLARGDGFVAFPGWRLVCVPTKTRWSERSDIDAVADSAARLLGWVLAREPGRVAVPALGCGLGGLDWAEVRPRLAATLPDPPFVLLDPT